MEIRCYNNNICESMKVPELIEKPDVKIDRLGIPPL